MLVWITLVGLFILLVLFGKGGGRMDLLEINPATGLSMTAYGVDLQGNPPGVDLY